jgi:hypothetical protein
MRQYFNDPQQEVMFTGAKDNVIVGGRGIGKGLIQASWNLRNFQRMPGSCSGIVGVNGKRVLTNTLPSMLVHWENWGYKRDVHWCIGRRPPESWGWGRPIFEPQSYDNVLSFYNGSIGFIISQDRAGTSNSQSYDAITVDEAKFIDFDQLNNETLQANRGNKMHFGQHYFHHGMLITSDMPVTKKGSWFMNYKNKCDPELIETIQGMVHECWRLKKRIREDIAAGQQPPDYLRSHLRTLNRDMCRLRSVALLYREYSSIWNMQVLGEKWVNDMKRDLPPLTFMTSILCKPIGIVKDGFYSSLTPAHKYHAVNYTYLDSLEYQFDKLKTPSSLSDADVETDMPICVAFDANANINWLVAGQPHDRKLRVLKSFFVKYERKLPELVDDFCEYYRHHKNKTVVFYYDHTFLNGNYAVNDQDFAWVIEHQFVKNGWTVNRVYIGQTMKPMERYLLINRMLTGRTNLRPVFNEANNEDLLISIQTAGVYNGAKDKRGEKLAETEEDKLESRTDGSDAFDTLCVGCERFPKVVSNTFVTSSW